MDAHKTVKKIIEEGVEASKKPGAAPFSFGALNEIKYPDLVLPEEKKQTFTAAGSPERTKKPLTAPPRGGARRRTKRSAKRKHHKHSAKRSAKRKQTRRG